MQGCGHAPFVHPHIPDARILASCTLFSKKSSVKYLLVQITCRLTFYLDIFNALHHKICNRHNLFLHSRPVNAVRTTAPSIYLPCRSYPCTENNITMKYRFPGDHLLHPRFTYFHARKGLVLSANLSLPSIKDVS